MQGSLGAGAGVCLSLYPKVFGPLQPGDITCLLSAYFRLGKDPGLCFQKG